MGDRDREALDPTELPASSGPSSPGTAHAGQRFGPYRLLGRLGEGGMGEVWEAEQTEPVRRRVALKVIKPGMDTKQVVARFEAERQALALMDHPAIAKVFDAGVAPNGRPYFVMEHVAGLSITEHCDRHKLTNRQRLALFLQVCEGVQHAHQKAVIHRDLKPSNVLVTMRDDKPMPKIIDFGVAKATAQKLTDRTMHTQLGVMIGTPAYMSPEQAEFSGQDVDTRTDVYALGVMLYELLVGALPFDPEELREAGVEAMVRKIRETEPVRPSTRLSTLGDDSTQSVERRRTELPALRRELSGDLDWITMKALEKDRARRYSSPQELAADIGRYLSDEPVLASPPSAVYRAGKFVRRHRVGVAAATAGLLVLLAFAAMMAVQARRIAAERDRANAEALRAGREAEAKGLVSEFLKDLFAVSDPGQSRGNDITARELLDRGAEKIESTLADQPEIRAELIGTMGDVYVSLGLYGPAEPLLEQALAERKRRLGDDHLDTLNAMNSLANLYRDQGRYAEAERLYTEILETTTRVLGSDERGTLNALNNLALLYQRQGRYAEAEPLYVEAVATKKRVLGEDHPDTLNSMHNLADLYQRQSRYAEAEPLYLATVDTRRRVLGSDHPETLGSVGNLAVLYQVQGRYAEAEPLYLEVLATKRRVLGEDHPDTLGSMANLAGFYQFQGRHAEAEPLYVEVLAAETRVLGEDHPDTLLSMNALGSLYQHQGRYAEAERLLLDSLAANRRVLGDDHAATLLFMNNLADLYRSQKRYAEAEALLRETLATQKRVLGDDHFYTMVTMHNIACVNRDTGRFAAARQLFERVQRFCEDRLRPEHSFALANLDEYAELLRKTGDDAAAERLEARATAIRGDE